MTIAEFCSYAEEKLNNLSSIDLKYELRVLLEEYLNKNLADLIIARNNDIPKSKLKLLFKAVELRTQGMPLQYILGSWEFMNIRLEIGRGVLIPRQDTQVLVETASDFTVNNKCNINIIDLCSGSGCIAFALEKILKIESKIYAIEASKKAYEYLSRNIKHLNSKVCGIKGDVFKLYDNFEDNFFDTIVSNPPYIKTNEIKYLQKEVLFEPVAALDGGKDGLDFYRKICQLWFPKLKPKGHIIFEIGEGQYQEVKNIMINSGFKDIQFKRDINNIIRVIVGTRSSKV